MKRIIVSKSDEVCAWVAERNGGQASKGWQTGVGLEQDGRWIAGVVYDSYNGASIQMHVAAIPGAQWLNRAFLVAAFWFPFNELNVRKILGPVSSANLEAQRFDRHLGFTLEATLKEACTDGDLLIFSMTKSQCRWLNLRIDLNGLEIKQRGNPGL